MFKTWNDNHNHKTKIITSKSMCQEKKRVWGLARCSQFQKKILKWLKKTRLATICRIEDATFQKFYEEVKEKKIELTVGNDGNQDMVTIENIVEDQVEVKYDDESITLSP